jgi:acyl-CoA synthetase (AMP-forming)/AMP-acid ligase II
VTLLRVVAENDPDVEAFVDADGNRCTFAEWNRAADGISAAFAERGVRAGDVVCVMLPSTIEYMVCYQAAARLGAVVSGVNTRLGPAELGHLFECATPRLTVVADDDDRALPPTAGAVVSWTTVAPMVDAPPPRLPRVRDDQPLVLCWTGGTTGRPRGVWFDHRNLRAVATMTGVLSEPYDRRLSPIPFAHIGTMSKAWDEIGRCITTVITPTQWTAPGTLALMERERVTVAQGVPTQWELVLRDPAFSTTNLSGLRLAGIGGSSVPPDLLRRMRTMLGVPIVNRYASTESGGIISGTRPDDSDAVVVGTVGRAADGVELRVVDDDRNVVDAGAPGRVQVRSAAVMRGYWKDADATAAAIDGDGWLTVGDLGRLDADGNLELVGRVGDMYVRGGYNVYPIEVERRLAEHPDLSEVAVVAIADDMWGEIGVAVVVPVDAAPTLDDVRWWVSADLARYKAPDRLVVLDAMPLTAVGKVDRRELVAHAEKGAES